MGRDDSESSVRLREVHQRHDSLDARSRLYVVVHSYLGEVCGRTGDTAGAHQALTAALQAAEAGGHATLFRNGAFVFFAGPSRGDNREGDRRCSWT